MESGSITVIVPAFNCESTIEKCLDSIFNQKRSELIDKIIVIDDGSTDRTAFIIERVASSRKGCVLLLQQHNSGVSSARNLGITHCKTEWLAFCDADDEWFPDKLSFQEEAIVQHPDAVMVAGNIGVKLQRIGWFKKPLVCRVNYKDMLVRSFPQTSTVLVQKKAVLDMGCFDKEQSFCEDMNLFIKIASKYPYYHLNRQLVLFGSGKPQIGSSVGLSAKLDKMNNGAIKNLNDFLQIGIINRYEYLLLLIFNELKYIRRRILKRMNSMHKNKILHL